MPDVLLDNIEHTKKWVFIDSIIRFPTFYFTFLLILLKLKLCSWGCYIYYSAKNIKKRPWYNNVKCCGIKMPFAFSFAICNFHIAFAFLNERILCTWHYHVCRKHPKCNSLQEKGDEIMYAMHFPTKQRFISICQNFKQNAKLFPLF